MGVYNPHPFTTTPNRNINDLFRVLDPSRGTRFRSAFLDTAKNYPECRKGVNVRLKRSDFSTELTPLTCVRAEILMKVLALPIPCVKHSGAAGEVVNDQSMFVPAEAVMDLVYPHCLRERKILPGGRKELQILIVATLLKQVLANLRTVCEDADRIASDLSKQCSEQAAKGIHGTASSFKTKLLKLASATLPDWAVMFDLLYENLEKYMVMYEEGKQNQVPEQHELQIKPVLHALLAMAVEYVQLYPDEAPAEMFTMLAKVETVRLPESLQKLVVQLLLAMESQWHPVLEWDELQPLLAVFMQRKKPHTEALVLRLMANHPLFGKVFRGKLTWVKALLDAMSQDLGGVEGVILLLQRLGNYDLLEGCEGDPLCTNVTKSLFRVDYLLKDDLEKGRLQNVRYREAMESLHEEREWARWTPPSSDGSLRRDAIVASLCFTNQPRYIAELAQSSGATQYAIQSEIFEGLFRSCLDTHATSLSGLSLLHAEGVRGNDLPERYLSPLMRALQENAVNVEATAALAEFIQKSHMRYIHGLQSQPPKLCSILETVVRSVKVLDRHFARACLSLLRSWKWRDQAAVDLLITLLECDVVGAMLSNSRPKYGGVFDFPVDATFCTILPGLPLVVLAQAWVRSRGKPEVLELVKQKSADPSAIAEFVRCVARWSGSHALRKSLKPLFTADVIHILEQRDLSMDLARLIPRSLRCKVSQQTGVLKNSEDRPFVSKRLYKESLLMEKPPYIQLLPWFSSYRKAELWRECIQSTIEGTGNLMNVTADLLSSCSSEELCAILPQERQLDAVEQLMSLPDDDRFNKFRIIWAIMWHDPIKLCKPHFLVYLFSQYTATTDRVDRLLLQVFQLYEHEAGISTLAPAMYWGTMPSPNVMGLNKVGVTSFIKRILPATMRRSWQVFLRSKQANESITQVSTGPYYDPDFFLPLLSAVLRSLRGSRKLPKFIQGIIRSEWLNFAIVALGSTESATRLSGLHVLDQVWDLLDVS